MLKKKFHTEKLKTYRSPWKRASKKYFASRIM